MASPLVASFALAALALPGPAAAQSGAVVHGTVYDSLSRSPFAGATVVLWNTPHRATSGPDGRYRMPDVPPGSYQVAFFHAHLAAIGASAAPRSVTISTDSVRVDLAGPSATTVARATCVLEGHGPETGVVTGAVFDAASGLQLPGARLTLSWGDESLREPSGELGRYTICAAPAGERVLVRASFFDRVSLFRSVDVHPEGVELDLAVLSLRTSTLRGRLADAATGEGIADALVRLEATAHAAITDSKGEFTIDDVAPGEHTLSSSHLAYAPRSDPIGVPEGSLVEVEALLADRPIELEPIHVEIEATPQMERAAGGIQITRAEIERVRHLSRDVGDLLRAQNIPGVIIRRRADGSLCVGSVQGQVRMLYNQGCVPMLIFVNGARSSNTDLALRIPPDAIDRITIYKPVEAGNLFGLGSGNGVLMIYTKGS